MKRLRFGVMLIQSYPWREMLERCRYVEELGFDSVWVADHLAAHRLWFDGWSLLAGLAASTERIRIGALVTSITFRHPALLAKQALTVDHISNGRLDLGIGAAGAREDHAAVGENVWDFKERVERFREFIEALDSLLRNDTTNYSGRYYTIRNAVRPISTVQSPRPPLTIAAHSSATLQIAAQYADTWNSLGYTMKSLGAESRGETLSSDVAFEGTRKRGLLLDKYAGKLGRDPKDIRRSFSIGFSPDAPFESIKAFQEFVRKYQQIGIDEFTLFWSSEDDVSRTPNCVYDRASLQRLAEEWIPSLQGQ